MTSKSIIAIATFFLCQNLWAQSQLLDRSEFLEMLDLCMLRHETSLTDWTLSQEQELQIAEALSRIETAFRETGTQPILSLVETQCLLKSKQLEEAIGKLTNPRYDFGSDDYVEETLGRIALLRNENNKAVEIFSSLLEETSFSTDIAYFLSVALERLNEIDRAKNVALSELDKLTDGMLDSKTPIYNPDQVAVFIRYSEIFLSNNEKEAALEILNRGLEYNAASSELFDRIYMIYEQESNIEAIAELKAKFCNFPVSEKCNS